MAEADQMPRARRSRRRPEDLLNQLIDAAEQEFKAAGFAGATTAAIARRAETTEAQLFRYFPSKAALFRRAMVEPLEAHFAAFMARREPAAAISDQARNYIVELQDFLAAHERMFLSLIAAEAFPHDAIAGVAGVDGLREYFENGAATMTANGGPGFIGDADLAVRVSFGAVLASVIFRDWLFAPDRHDDASVRDAVIRFVLYGIHGEPPASADRDMKR